MSSLLNAISSPESLTALLLDAAVKGFVIVVLASMIVFLLRKQAAARRHLVWSLAAAGLLALPSLSTCLPTWRIPIPASWVFAISSAPPSIEAEIAMAPGEEADKTFSSARLPRSSERLVGDQSNPRGGSVPEAAPRTSGASFLNPNMDEVSETVAADSPTHDAKMAVATVAEHTPTAKAEASNTSLENATPRSSVGSHRLHWLLPIWFAGVLLVLFVPAIGLGQLSRLRRSAKPILDEPWRLLLQEVACELGIGRKIRLLLSEKTRMPLTWGVLRPIVLLPAEAETWEAPQRRMVLLHELAHVKRLDWLTQMIGQLACAVHWFNPMAWFVARRMHVDREQACDDMVLAAGASPKLYAMELVRLACRLRLGSFAALAAVPMARQTSLEQRIRGILDESRKRTSVTRIALVSGIAIAVCLLVPLAMMQAFAQQVPAANAKPNAEPPKSAQDMSPPKAVHLSNEGMSAFFVHDGSTVDYAFIFVGEFKSSTAFTSNSEDKTWQEKGALKFLGRQIAFERNSTNDQEVRINGLKAMLKNGRVFLIKPKLDHPNAQQALQLNISLPMLTKANLQDVFVRAHQPEYLPVSKLGFAGEYPPGSGKGRSLSLYSRHDDFRTRFALVHSSGQWEVVSNDENNPADGSWKIDTSIKLPNRILRLQCDSSAPDELRIGTQQFDLTKGRVIEIKSNGGELQQRAEFPRVLRNQDDLLALYARLAGVRPKAVSLVASRKQDLPDGVTVEISRKAFHGADIMTTAILRWPATKDLPALRYEMHIAADAFGNREQWAAAWERGSTRLWIVNSGLGARFPNLRTIDFANPRRIQTWTAYGSGEFKTSEPSDDGVNARREPVSLPDRPPRVPGEIMENLASTIPLVRNLQSRSRRFGGKHIDSASIEEQFIVQGHVRGLDKKPIKGMLINVFTEYHPTIRVATVRTDGEGRYQLKFRMDLRTLDNWRGLTVKPLASGFVDDDFARSGHLAMKISPDDELKLSDSKKAMIPGQAATANFVMQPAATLEGRIVRADGKPWANLFVGVKFKGQRRGYTLTSGSTDEDGRFRLTNVPTEKPLFLTTSRKNRDETIQLGQFQAERTSNSQRLSVVESDSGWTITKSLVENPVRVKIVSGHKEMTPPSNPVAFANKMIDWAESCRVNRADILGFNPDVWDDVLAGHTYVHVALNTPRRVKLVGVDKPLAINEIVFAMYTLGPGAMYVKSGEQVVCLNHWTLDKFRPVIAEPALQARKVDWYKRLLDATRKEHATTKKTAIVKVDATGKLEFMGEPVEVNELIKRLQAAGHSRKESTVILSTDPNIEVKQLHRPLWKLSTSRWAFVRLVFANQKLREPAALDTPSSTSENKPDQPEEVVMVRGVNVAVYPSTSNFASITQLRTPDPKRPGETLPSPHVFELTVSEKPQLASIRYAVDHQAYFVSLYKNNTLVRTYGPIPGDPFEQMKLMKRMREMSPDRRERPLASMLQSVDVKLRSRAYELIPELPAQRFRSTYETLRKRVKSALARFPNDAAQSAGKEAEAWLSSQLAAWHARRIKAPDSEYVEGEPSSNVPRIVWSEPNEVGLRLGYSPAPWRTEWFYQDIIEMDVWIDNAGDEAVKFTSTSRTDEGFSVTMKPLDGQAIPWGVVHWDTLLFGTRRRLAPKTRVKIKSVKFTLEDKRNDPAAVRKGYTGWFKLEPGDYTMSMQVEVPGLEQLGRGDVVNTPAAGEWIGVLTTKPLKVTVGEAPTNEKGRPATANKKPEMPQVTSMTQDDHSAFALQTKDKVNFVLYSPDQLQSEISSVETDGKWRFHGPIHIMRDGKRLRSFELNYSSEQPDHLYIDDQKHTLRQVIARTVEGALSTSGRLFALSADLPPLNTERTLKLRNARDLATIHKMAGWDLILARQYRYNRELDAMDGWIMSWNDQHMIQHSDGAHVAQMRIFPDGRVIVPDRQRGLVTLKLPKAAVAQLLNELREHPAAQRLGKRTPQLVKSTAELRVSPARGGHWDQASSRVLFKYDGQTYSLFYLSKSLDGRPQTGMSDQAWNAIANRLYALAARVKKTTQE